MAIGDSNEKRIKFSADGSDLNSFMKKLMNDQKSLYAEFAKSAKAQTDNQKEQLKIIEAQIKALDRKSRLEKEILRDQARQLREYGGEKEQVEADRLEQQIRDRRLSDKNKVSGLKDMLQDDKDRLPGRGSVGSQVFNATLLASIVKDTLQAFRATATADNGLALVSPMLGVSGGALGGLTGSAIDTVKNSKFLGSGLGDTQLGPILAKIGQEAGSYMGDAIVRSFKLKSEFDTAAFGYRAITGQNANVPRLSYMGLDDIAVAQSMQKLARASGGSGNQVATVLGLSRGFGIDEGATLGAAGLNRMGTGGITNAQRGLGIAIAEGLNRSKFSDVIANQTALLTEFSKSANSPSNQESNRALFEFNRIGGPFSIGDPRAMGNISGLQEGLSSPGSAFGQAQNYAVLRRLNPNSSIFQLRKMQQQGLQTPGFLSAIMNDIAGGSGSPDLQKFQMSARFPNLSLDSIEKLFENRGKIGSMSQTDLNKMLSTDKIQKEAEENTSKLMRYNAEVTNAFRDNFLEGIKTIKNQFVTEFKDAIIEVAKTWKEEVTGSGPKYKATWNDHGKTPSKNGTMSKQDSTYQNVVKDYPMIF